jgi:hypothetical protein
MSNLAKINQSKALAADTGFKTALEPRSIPDALQIADMAAGLKMCGTKSVADGLFRIMQGRMLGMSAMQSITAIRDVQGTPVISASAILALCLNHPAIEYFTMVESTDDHATFKAKRRGQDEVVMTYTREHAKKAGLLGKDNYNKQEGVMYRWRCVCALARIVAPDALMGMYGQEEFAPGAVAGSPPPSAHVDFATVAAVPVANDSGPRVVTELTMADVIAKIDTIDSAETARQVGAELAAAIKSGELPESHRALAKELLGAKYAEYVTK